MARYIEGRDSRAFYMQNLILEAQETPHIEAHMKFQIVVVADHKNFAKFLCC